MESYEQTSFIIISASGDAMAAMLKSLDFARNGQFEEAENQMQEANSFISKAHKAQTNLITEEAKGNKAQYSMLMVHAQDHLMNSMLAKVLITEMIQLYKKIGK